MKAIWLGYTLTALGMTVAQAVSLATGGTLSSLASPEAILVEHGFMLVFGGWGLLEIIKQGKRMATRADIDKVRDDVTAILTNYQDTNDKRVDHVTNRLDDLWERRSKSR